MSSSSAAALAGAGPRTNPGTLCRSRALASAGVALAAAKVPASADRAAAVSGPGGVYIERRHPRNYFSPRIQALKIATDRLLDGRTTSHRASSARERGGGRPGAGQVIASSCESLSLSRTQPSRARRPRSAVTSAHQATTGFFLAFRPLTYDRNRDNGWDLAQFIRLGTLVIEIDHPICFIFRSVHLFSQSIHLIVSRLKLHLSDVHCFSAIVQVAFGPARICEAWQLR